MAKFPNSRLLKFVVEIESDPINCFRAMLSFVFIRTEENIKVLTSLTLIIYYEPATSFSVLGT
jgi:hypothetical protein